MNLVQQKGDTYDKKTKKTNYAVRNFFVDFWDYPCRERNAHYGGISPWFFLYRLGRDLYSVSGRWIFLH